MSSRPLSAQTLRERTSRALATTALGLLVLGVPLAALAADEHVEYVGWVEQAKGHLQASRETYRKGQRVRADVHASHPIQELGSGAPWPGSIPSSPGHSSSSTRPWRVWSRLRCATIRASRSS